MGGIGGRPKGGQDANTRQVRVHADVAEKIAWIVRLIGKNGKKGGDPAYANTARLLDPMIRAQIDAIYQHIAPRVEAIKKKLGEVENLESEPPPSLPNQDPPPPPSRRKRRG